MTPSSSEPAADEPFFSGVDTLPGLLARRATLTPTATAYFVQHPEGRWTGRTWAEYRDEVAALSGAFDQQGIGPGSRVGILARTSLAWETAQMAALARGATVAGIDPYYPDALLNQLVSELRLTALLVQDRATLRRVSAANQAPLRFIASLEGLPARGPAAWQSLAQPDAAALITFSSGSMGKPKPIAYTHAQVVHACTCLLQLYSDVSAGSAMVCWLPLANLFQRMMNFCALAKGNASYIVEDPRRVMEALPIARPEVFAAVPRFCEKLHAGIMQRLGKTPLLSRLVERLPPLKRLMDRLVLAGLRRAMGGRLKFIISGSAPMPRWLVERFDAIGIPILEAYGVSENLVPISANRLMQRRPGTVGQPAGDNEVRISRDGEVQVRGRGVFLRKLQDNAAHDAAFTDDGFLATGDLGALDEAGFLTLHGRRGEAFKNAQGRWVALSHIEAALRRLPDVEHAAVVRRPGERLIAVLALAPAGDREAHPVGDGEARRAALRRRLAVELEMLPRAMRPVALLVVSAGFSPATGELTTNLKLRRGAIEEKFAHALRSLDGESPSGNPAELPLKFV